MYVVFVRLRLLLPPPLLSAEYGICAIECRVCKT
jgi:hypothetical protein